MIVRATKLHACFIKSSHECITGPDCAAPSEPFCMCPTSSGTAPASRIAWCFAGFTDRFQRQVAASTAQTHSGVPSGTSLFKLETSTTGSDLTVGSICRLFPPINSGPCTCGLINSIAPSWLQSCRMTMLDLLRIQLPLPRPHDAFATLSLPLQQTSHSMLRDTRCSA